MPPFVKESAQTVAWQPKPGNLETSACTKTSFIVRTLTINACVGHILLSEARLRCWLLTAGVSPCVFGI